MSGAIGWIDPGAVDAVHRMTAAQQHRGPDDEGFYESTGGAPQPGAAFGFRRLAIIDLSPGGRQPMVDDRSGCAMVFNGEIYNFRELRRELEGLSAQFVSHGDSEVLLKAYVQWGPKAIERLRGMFALAIWDPRTRRVLLARDRLGIKPVYFSTVRRPAGHPLVLFASEVRALLASGLIERRMNRAALSTYMWNGFVAGTDSIIEGVQLLEAATIANVDVDSGLCRMERYWTMPQEGEELDGAERLRDALHSATRQHLVSDVPLGVFLSGGVDSSAIAALAVQEAGAAVNTFNISFDEAAFDESQHARAVAGALGTNHHEIRLTQTDFRQQLPEALECLDQPTFDAINTYFVSRAVRDAGITVALTGTGGDELFGGYRSFQDIPRAVRWARTSAVVPSGALALAATAAARVTLGRGTAGEVPPQTRWGKLGDVLASRGKLLELYQTSYALFTSSFIDELLQDGLHADIRSGLPHVLAQELAVRAGERASLHAISTLELSCFIGQRLLRDTDAASMAVSLEVRVPLLDHLVVEAAASVDPATRFRPLGKKALLRRLALDHLDSRMFNRPKSGFVLPIDVWCRQELKGALGTLLADADACAQVGLNPEAVARLWRSFSNRAPGIYWSRVWAIFVLLWWARRHDVRL